MIHRRCTVLNICKGPPQTRVNGMQVSRQTSMRGDRYSQCPPRCSDLCPIPKISDIFSRSSDVRFTARIDRLFEKHKGRARVPFRVEGSLWMTNSFNHWPRNGQRKFTRDMNTYLQFISTRWCKFSSEDRSIA